MSIAKTVRLYCIVKDKFVEWKTGTVKNSHDTSKVYNVYFCNKCVKQCMEDKELTDVSMGW